MTKRAGSSATPYSTIEVWSARAAGAFWILAYYAKGLLRAGLACWLSEAATSLRTTVRNQT
jgi:hypothetical protein